MDVALKVTDVPEEASFADLVSGDNVLSIPLFQRPYRWGKRNLQLLLDDINQIKEDVASSVFLGVILSYRRPSGPGRPALYEVVDGQQRVTTLYLLVMAAAEIAAKRGSATWAEAIVGSYLLVRPMSNNPTNTKLIPSYADRAQFAGLWLRISELSELKASPGFAFNRPMPPPASGAGEGDMTKQYARLRSELGSIFDDGGIAALEQFVETAVRQLSVVSISLRDPAVAPKIFERMNSRAEPVTIADLVRNEIFSQAGDDAVQAQYVFSTHWEPFVSRFSQVDADVSKFLFPYGLIENPNIKKAELFAQLRDRWRKVGGPQAIIADLERYTPTFLALEAGVRDVRATDKINELLNKIHRVGRPSSVYSFLMSVIDSYATGSLSEDDAIDVLASVESFLFRRAVMGIEPTGLHSAFKGLWNELSRRGGDGPINGAAVRAAVAAKPTITWPSDRQFREAIASSRLYGRKIAAFALREHELSLRAETPSDEFHIEHVAPQTPTDHWKGVMGDDYPDLVDTWGNLIALTDTMNSGVSQRPFAEKKLSFTNSKFGNAREVASLHSEWTPDVIRARNTAIGEWALKRWRY